MPSVSKPPNTQASASTAPIAPEQYRLKVREARRVDDNDRADMSNLHCGKHARDGTAADQFLVWLVLVLDQCTTSPSAGAFACSRSSAFKIRRQGLRRRVERTFGVYGTPPWIIVADALETILAVALELPLLPMAMLPLWVSAIVVAVGTTIVFCCCCAMLLFASTVFTGAPAPVCVTRVSLPAG